MKRFGDSPKVNTDEADADIRRWYDGVDIRCLVSYLNAIHGPDIVFDEMSVMCRHVELTAQHEVAA